MGNGRLGWLGGFLSDRARFLAGIRPDRPVVAAHLGPACPRRRHRHRVSEEPARQPCGRLSRPRAGRDARIPHLQRSPFPGPVDRPVRLHPVALCAVVRLWPSARRPAGDAVVAGHLHVHSWRRLPPLRQLPGAVRLRAQCRLAGGDRAISGAVPRLRRRRRIRLSDLRLGGPDAVGRRLGRHLRDHGGDVPFRAADGRPSQGAVLAGREGAQRSARFTHRNRERASEPRLHLHVSAGLSARPPGAPLRNLRQRRGDGACRRVRTGPVRLFAVRPAEPGHPDRHSEPPRPPLRPPRPLRPSRRSCANPCR